MTDLAETILRDVPRRPDRHGVQYVSVPEVLAALTAALDPAIAERAGEVLEGVKAAEAFCRSEECFLQADHFKKAADLITALLAQNAALRAERDTLKADLKKETALAENMVDQVSNLLPAVNREAVEQRARAEAAEAKVEKLRGALQIAKSIFDTPIGLRRLGIDPNTDERLIEFRALTTEADNG